MSLPRPVGVALLVTLFAALAGCGTIAGIGEDISAGARTVQRIF